MRVVLVHMPWGALERPALGLSLLAAGIGGRPGVEVEVRYLNMPLADAIGADCYQWITHDLPHIAFAGEWLFTEALFGPDARRDTQYVNEILRREWQLPDAHVNTLLRVRTYIEPYFARVLSELDWSDTDLVGFTSTFEQNVASLALARRLKERYPKIVTAFGGANWEAVMGQEYHRALPFVDLCCSRRSRRQLSADHRCIACSRHASAHGASAASLASCSATAGRPLSPAPARQWKRWTPSPFRLSMGTFLRVSPVRPQRMSHPSCCSKPRAAVGGVPNRTAHSAD